MNWIKKVTVIGANGTMGANVSGIFASFGNAKVYMICRDLTKANEAVRRVVKSVRADSIKNNLIPADYSMLVECVQDSDLVFESVSENWDVKLELTKKIADALAVRGGGTIVCSGTSGLSITALAECFPADMRGNYFGVHMFNPPYSMTLCELITTDYTNKERLTNLRNYLEAVLVRTVVEVKDSPAFLANRIGFQFINEVLQYAEQYQNEGGIDYMDAILGTFSGRAMPPLVTADFVGLDVHKAIVDNLQTNTSDYLNHTYFLPEFAQRLIDEGKLGRKSGCGLYMLEITADGRKKQLVYDISSGEYREKRKYALSFAENMKRYINTAEYEKALSELVTSTEEEAKICLRFLLSYIVYALVVTGWIGGTVHSADDAMATGFNWCPPLALVDAFSKVTDIKALIVDRLEAAILDNIDVGMLFSHLEKSRFDFRPYFKSGK